ncbi:response regulator [Desulfofalx alkaliphila]|uniref:response regulator n=1 Tax=Desulfofalx alkaliphila TaxID=105483 RepID=UPI00068A2B93|nr:response regulator [Desulfofalx alkaliphila]
MENNIKVLLVDDKPENIFALQAVLDSPMYQLITANSGEEALKCVLKHNFAVILLDIQMPGFDGFETAKIIRTREKSKYTPIIFITAIYKDPEQVRQGYALGAIDYIFKPVDIDELKHKVEAFVHLYKYREQLEKIVQHRTKQLETANQNLRQEINERKRFAMALSESESRYRAIFDNAKIGIALLDSKGCILESNATLSQMLGYSRQQLKNRIFDDFSQPQRMHYAYRHEILDSMGDYYKQQKPFFIKDGGVVWGEVTKSVLKDEAGDCRYTIVMVEDITEKKQFQEKMFRLDRLNMIGEMAASISHEVRNPMTTIKGFLQMLRDKKEYQAERHYFDLMIDEIDRANSIITEFLSIGKNTATEFKVQNLNEIVKTIAPLMQADALQLGKNIELELKETPDIPLSGKEIRQVILNLVRNGLEAMAQGGKVTIRTYADGDSVVLEIADQGPGIPQYVMENLGTPFFTTKDKGTGLGLATCFSICNSHRAKVDIDTGPAGTTFRIIFGTR